MDMYRSLRQGSNVSTTAAEHAAAQERSDHMRAARANRELGCNKCQWRKESGCKICQKYGGSQNPLTQEASIFWESDKSQAIVPLALFNAVENLGGYSRVSKLNLWETVHRSIGLSAHKGHSQERISAFIKSAL